MADYAGKTPFEYLYDALARRYPGLAATEKGTVFQFCTAPIAADWVTRNDLNAYHHCNTVPANLDGFYVPGSNLDASYSTFIKSLKPEDADDNPLYNNKLKALNDLIDEQTAVTNKANAAYQVWAANNKNPDGTVVENKTVWLQDPMGGQSWGERLKLIQDRVRLLNQEMADILKAMESPLADAVFSLNRYMMNISDGGTPYQVPSVSIGGDFAADRRRWDDYPEDQYDFDVRIDKSTMIQHPWPTVTKATVTRDSGGRIDLATINTSPIIPDANYSLRITAKGLQGYQITRAPWYKDALVQPDAEIVPGAGVCNDTFFGAEGCLHLIPETIFVMYKPSFELTIPTNTYRQEFEANAAGITSMDFLSFHFNLGNLHSLYSMPNADNTTTITLRSQADAVPQILGVASQLKWNGR